jgi:hypothetical protein
VFRLVRLCDPRRDASCKVQWHVHDRGHDRRAYRLRQVWEDEHRGHGAPEKKELFTEKAAKASTSRSDDGVRGVRFLGILR